jgi:hypothetical protein
VDYIKAQKAAATFLEAVLIGRGGEKTIGAKFM